MSFQLSAYRDRLSYQILLLGGACALVSLLLVAGNELTLPRIGDHLVADKLAMLAQVLPASAYNNNPLEHSEEQASPQLAEPVVLMQATRDEQLQANILQLIVPGWGGPLNMIMAVNPAGEVLGVRVISHKETPGLADKIERAKSDWITGFEGHSLANTSAQQWKVKKDGGEFDQFTGATITPRAVVRGVHEGLLIQQQWQQKGQPSTSQPPTGASSHD
ncbi:RnfABCDGE type electron transport complex subunit G [Parathalassolituus penaei]|uniref:Ion-translocating oxidoreductase complex subunit G n=1 Tax=Parathalassolituus penaei TaxID=2997323 RepID=A0A9X3ISJ2_9GAMM|nr:RnfABCDGE type electron transport complex subunit G [Parathalassolituus penaei]MCY0965315.1 RnfABCDGE type electron transport complex subunit G [Parathalassolituus penaei]